MGAGSKLPAENGMHSNVSYNFSRSAGHYELRVISADTDKNEQSLKIMYDGCNLK